MRRVWVFDLDNTLHNAFPHIFPHINRAMTEYLMAHLKLDEAGANQLREHYWHRYGATLLGLMRHHGTDPDHFLRETHQFPDLPRMVVKERGLRAMLKGLPGRKVVFSNAPIHYTRAVLAILHIADLFDGVFSVEHTGYWPKPYAKGFHRLFRKLKLNPRRAVMVEDSVGNLRTAKRLGMKTVWVTPAVKRPAYVDLNVRSVLELPRLMHKLF
jgi:pyrimidine 5''-nucleotidase